jgi:hypothetical protein
MEIFYRVHTLHSKQNFITSTFFLSFVVLISDVIKKNIKINNINSNIINYIKILIN